jgi:hypothetical protein
VLLQHAGKSYVGLEFVVGGDWELDEVPAMADPAHMVQVGRNRRVSTGEGQRRMAVVTEKSVLVAGVDVAADRRYASGR